MADSLQHAGVAVSDPPDGSDDEFGFDRDMEADMAVIGRMADIPYLPQEILDTILEYTCAEDTLAARLTCRAFNDTVEKRVIQLLTQRTELVLFLHLDDEFLLSDISDSELQSLNEVSAGFAFTSNAPDWHHSGLASKWDDKYAYFQINLDWMKRFASFQESDTFPILKQLVAYNLDPKDGDNFGINLERVGWMVKLDSIVNDIPLPGFKVELEKGLMRVDYRLMLRTLMKEFYHTRKLIEEDSGTHSFTYSLQEDYTRYVRRIRIDNCLDFKPKRRLDKKYRWAMKNNALQALFGEPDALLFTRDRTKAQELRDHEDKVMKKIMHLTELVHIKQHLRNDPVARREHEQFIAERAIMLEQLATMTDMKQVSTAATRSIFRLDASDTRMGLADNNDPLTWTKDTRELEDYRIAHWRPRKELINELIENHESLGDWDIRIRLDAIEAAGFGTFNLSDIPDSVDDEEEEEEDAEIVGSAEDD